MKTPKKSISLNKDLYSKNENLSSNKKRTNSKFRLRSNKDFSLNSKLSSKGISHRTSSSYLLKNKNKSKGSNMLLDSNCNLLENNYVFSITVNSLERDLEIFSIKKIVLYDQDGNIIRPLNFKYNISNLELNSHNKISDIFNLESKVSHTFNITNNKKINLYFKFSSKIKLFQIKYYNFTDEEVSKGKVNRVTAAAFKINGDNIFNDKISLNLKYIKIYTNNISCIKNNKINGYIKAFKDIVRNSNDISMDNSRFAMKKNNELLKSKPIVNCSIINIFNKKIKETFPEIVKANKELIINNILKMESSIKFAIYNNWSYNNIIGIKGIEILDNEGNTLNIKNIIIESNGFDNDNISNSILSYSEPKNYLLKRKNNTDKCEIIIYMQDPCTISKIRIWKYDNLINNYFNIRDLVIYADNNIIFFGVLDIYRDNLKYDDIYFTDNNSILTKIYKNNDYKYLKNTKNKNKVILANLNLYLDKSNKDYKAQNNIEYLISFKDYKLNYLKIKVISKSGNTNITELDDYNYKLVINSSTNSVKLFLVIKSNNIHSFNIESLRNNFLNISVVKLDLNFGKENNFSVFKKIDTLEGNKYSFDITDNIVNYNYFLCKRIITNDLKLVTTINKILISAITVMDVNNKCYKFNDNSIAIISKDNNTLYNLKLPYPIQISKLIITHNNITKKEVITFILYANNCLIFTSNTLLSEKNKTTDLQISPTNTTTTTNQNPKHKIIYTNKD